MRATVLTAPGRVALVERPAPTALAPTDAVVRVVAAAVCGSDLWWYRGDNAFDEPRRMGHEFVGRVESVGSAVASVSPGDFVLSAFKFGDNTCATCRDGYTSNCAAGGYWGSTHPDGSPLDGGQGELVRVPLADGTLLAVPEPEQERVPDLLALTDVMATGAHAANCAGVGPGADVVVIGDGAVGLCAVAASRRLGAARVTILSRHPLRQALARELGADEVIAVRGDAAVSAVRDLHDGIGPAHVLECVGTGEALATALDCARPGGQIGMVGIPHTDDFHPRQLFAKNLGLRGGGAPARALMDELLPDVLAGDLRSGIVFDRHYDLADVAQAYADMAARRTTKALLRVSPL